MLGFLSHRSIALIDCKVVRYSIPTFFSTRSSAFLSSRLHPSPLCPYPCHTELRCPLPQTDGARCTLSQRFRFLSTQSEIPKPVPSSEKKSGSESENSVSLVQRFKNAYKVYGKVLIVVHGITSAAWLGFFYLIAYSGLNVQELLVSLHAPELMLKPFRVAGGSVGVFASAYVLYKVATPFRYALTIWLTPVIVHRLRSGGWLPPLAEQDRLRNLALEGVKKTRERLRRKRKKRPQMVRK